MRSDSRSYFVSLVVRQAGRIFLILLLSFGVGCAGLLDAPPNPDEASPKARSGGGGRGDNQRSINDLGPVGSAARSLLHPESFPNVTVEVAFVEGRRPSEEALSHLEQVLQEAVKKPVRLTTHSITPGDAPYSAEEIVGISKSRSVRSSDESAALWIAYLDGEFSDNPNALGVTAAATVAAIFPDRISGVGSILNPGAIERAVLVHEVGHILALVNIGYRSKIDHEDQRHPGHSKNEGSVMHWAVEDISIASVFGGGPPSRFDEADMADLDMLRSS